MQTGFIEDDPSDREVVMPEIYSKEELIKAICTIAGNGWHQSVKDTRNTRNDGAVGNTLESLLGIEENNLPIPNAREWELKGQRLHSKSLLTLKHKEPSPTGVKFVASVLLPLYGWKHQQAGKRYPATEMSFRSTTRATQSTVRGFRIIVDRAQKKVRFVFDSSKANAADPEIASWLESVKQRVGLGPLDPEPYWGFDDLKYAIGSKIGNCFYVVANSKAENRQEYFKFEQLYMLSGFSFEKFLTCMESGIAYVDFDARTGHNHGTKFRLKQEHLIDLYSDAERVF